jgi:hypothetical protein
MPDPIEDFWAGYSPQAAEIGRALRAMVRATIPQAHEILVARDNYIGYCVGESPRNSVCHLCPVRDYVRLGFWYGGRLADPAHRLEGTGKRLRHVKVRTLAAAHDPALPALVAAAWAEALTHVQP